MLLARAVLSEYHHTHIGSGYQPYAMHDFLKGGTFTDEHGHTAVSHLTLLLYGTEKWNEFVLYQFFRYIVYRTEFHALHGSMYFGIVGHDDERLHLSFPCASNAACLYRCRQAGAGRQLLCHYPLPVADVSSLSIGGKLHGMVALPCQQVADIFAIHDVVLHHDYSGLIHFRIFSLSLFASRIISAPLFNTAVTAWLNSLSSGIAFP